MKDRNKAKQTEQKPGNQQPLPSMMDILRDGGNPLDFIDRPTRPKGFGIRADAYKSSEVFFFIVVTVASIGLVAGISYWAWTAIGFEPQMTKLVVTLVTAFSLPFLLCAFDYAFERYVPPLCPHCWRTCSKVADPYSLARPKVGFKCEKCGFLRC